MIDNDTGQKVNSNLLKDIEQEKSKLIERVNYTVQSISEDLILNCTSELVLAEQDKFTKHKPRNLLPQCQEITQLIHDIDSHLDYLGKLSYNPQSVEQYLWICDTAVNWEHLLLDKLNISRAVTIAKAPSNLLPPLDPGDALTEKELDLRVHSLSKIVRAYRILKGEHDTGIQELDRLDTYRAEIFLANDILSGTIDFARRISSRSYNRLEKIWMAEIRELLAYFEWEASGAELFDPNSLRHYCKAWDDFKLRIKAFDYKATRQEFGEAKRYLEDKYVTLENGRYKLKENLQDDTDIIQIKSQRLREEMGQWYNDRYWDDERNWQEAESYVCQYYENIIPAVMDGDEQSAQAVIQALDYSMKGPLRIINAFEMALVIYFVSTDTLKNIPFPG